MSFDDGVTLDIQDRHVRLYIFDSRQTIVIIYTCLFTFKFLRFSFIHY